MPEIPEGTPTFTLPAATMAARNYVAQEVLEAPIGVDPRLLFGVKIVLYATLALVRLYNRHRSNVVTQLPASMISVFDFLSSIEEFMRLLNKPGPV